MNTSEKFHFKSAYTSPKFNENSKEFALSSLKDNYESEVPQEKKI